MSSLEKALKICPECGADCAANTPRCWMCHASLQAVEPIVVAELATERKPAIALKTVSEWFFAISTVLLVAVAILVGIGLYLDEPGLGIAYSIVAGPALIAAAVRLRFQRMSGGRVSWAERFATIIVTGALTFSLLVLVGVAGIVGLVAFCLMQM